MATESQETLAQLDLAAIRAQFPALTRQIDGRPVMYLDGPAGSQVPQSVVTAVSDYLVNSNANTDGVFASSADTDGMIAAARESAADFLGCAADEVAFGQNTTTLNFLLAHAVARTLSPGDEILTTELDHEANVSPWLLVAKDHGLVVRNVPMLTEDATLDYSALENVVGDRTRIVACTLASNAVGSITDVDRVIALARSVGALSWVDGVHLAPHRRLDREGMGADVLLSSPYKYFGPHLGVASIRRELAVSWPSDRVRPADEQPAGHRFETGTLCHEAIAGFITAIDYIASLGDGESRRARLDDAFARIGRYEARLTARTLERMAEMPHCHLYGVSDPARVAERTPTFCFNLEGFTPRELHTHLAEKGIFSWDGNYYALGAMLALGLEDTGGAVRAGYLHYTTEDEVERFCDELASLA